MPVSYASKVYTRDKLFFLKLLFRWAGSVWELLWIDYLFFVIAYVTIAFVYHELLAEHRHRRLTFEAVVKWISLIRTSVPLSFMLGFFVSSVLSRWWNMCMCIPWMHAPSFFAQSLIDSSHPKKCDIARKMRITVLRYFNLSWILMMATISAHIKDRFGFNRRDNKERQFKLTWRQRLELINSDTKVQKYFGQLISDEEMKTFERSAELSKDNDFTYTPEYWLPLAWATRLLRRARNIDCIATERQYLWLVNVAQSFRNDLGIVWTYAEFNFPLVYTQVAVAAVYLFLFSTLLSTQMIESDMMGAGSRGGSGGSGGRFPGILSSANNGSASASIDVDHVPLVYNGIKALAYAPILGSLEFIFYLGWFKIGICLLNPLGRDKADLPLSEILNSNLKVSVKLGGAEDSLFPLGLTDNGEPEEQQVADFLRTFDFSGVHAHDQFGTAEENEAHLMRALLKRVQGTGKGIVNTLDVFQLTGQKKAARKAENARKRAVKGMSRPLGGESSRASAERSASELRFDSKADMASLADNDDASLSRAGSLPMLQFPDGKEEKA